MELWHELSSFPQEKEDSEGKKDVILCGNIGKGTNCPDGLNSKNRGKEGLSGRVRRADGATQ